MARNVCPECSQVTLSFGLEAAVRCPVCGTVYEVEPESIDIEDVPTLKRMLEKE